MIPTIKYLPVNWVDGMKISKEHFIHQEFSLYDQIRDTACINITDHNFGLLTPDYGSNQSLDLKLFTDHNRQVQVQVIACRAITRGGSRIEITQNSLHHPEASFPLEHNEKLLLDVIITVNPFSKMPVGQPNPEETPLRYPFAIPEYRVEIIPSDQIDITDLGAYHFTIGKIRVMGSEIKLTEHYIPPCHNLYCHPALESFYHEMGNALSQLGSNAIQVIKKVKLKNEQGGMQGNLLEVADRVATFLANQLDQYRMIIPHLPPIFLVEFFVRFARIFKTTLNCMSDPGREALLKYLMDWSELKPSALENSLDEMTGLVYNHMDTYTALLTSKRFMDSIFQLFQKLNQVEYVEVEKVKEAPPKPAPVAKQSIFITEEEEPKSTKKKSLWNF